MCHKRPLRARYRQIIAAPFIRRPEAEYIEKIKGNIKGTMKKMLRALTALTVLRTATLSACAASEAMTFTPHTYLLHLLSIVIIVVLIAAYIVSTARLRHLRDSTLKTVRTDSLTGIGNGVILREFLMNSMPEDHTGLYSVIYIAFDVNRVKRYYGTDAAKEQLHYAADMIRAAGEKAYAVARVAGGGFAVVRPCDSRNEAEKWSKDVLERLNVFCDRYGNDYLPRFRAGIYLFDQENSDYYTILYNSRLAYETAEIKDLPVVFSADETVEAEHEKTEFKKRLHKGLEDGEIQMYLQFVVGAKTGRIHSSEALSRWHHPEKGVLTPDRYIALLEEERTIPNLDFYIFEQVCAKQETWQKQGRHIHTSCNFSRFTIELIRFADRIREIAEKYSFDRSYVILEITENTVERETDTAHNNMHICHDMGFGIAIDDMGSGGASFQDLYNFPIDFVKIDRNIVIGAGTPNGKVLLDSMVKFGHNLGKVVVCEGIETEQQADMLCEMGCDLLQGFLFYRPVHHTEADRILADARQNAAAGPLTGIHRQ